MKKNEQPCSDQLEAFARFLGNEERSPATIEKYLRDVRCFLAYVCGEAADRRRILEYKAFIGGAYAVASANSMIAALNTFLRFCGRTDLCVRRFRVQRQAFCPEQKELTREEYFRLLTAAERRKKLRLSLIIQTICGTGIRVSELRYVTVESLRQGEANVSCKGKNRRIFLVPELKRKLSGYVKEHGLQSGPIFVTRSGKPVSRNNVWKEMKELCSSAGVRPEKVFPHNLRHLFARTFYAIEKDIAKLADILGHASINTTRIYVMTTGSEHRRRMERMHLIR